MPTPPYPEFHPAQTFHSSSRALREAPLNPRGPASGHLFPACTRAAPSWPAGTRSHFPGLAWDSEATHLRLRSRPLPARPVGPGTPHLGRPGEAACPSASRGPATSDSRGVRAVGVGGGQRPGLERLRGRTGSESWAIPRDCAARSGGQVGARGGGTGPAPRPAQPAAVRGAAEPSPPLAQRTQAPDAGGREAPCRARSPFWKRRALAARGLLCSDLSRRPELELAGTS